MRNRVTLQERVLTENAYGEQEETWNDVLTLCASFEPLKGQEFFKSGDLPQTVAEVDARVRIRYRKGLDPARHRIVFDGVVHDLVAVIADRGRGQTQLMVKAVSVQQSDGSRVNG